ncbi:MAG: SRPBCC family protein [Acidobacteriaceae bacterium]|nr:SRPBCC family protein [Acidobacteriaceae bacterium]
MATRERSQNSASERLANGLGWFSVGLGLAEVAAPGKLAELIGIRDKSATRAMLRVYGLREIAAGVGILSQTQPATWLWGRVAGDILDLSTMGSAFASRHTDRARLGTATAAVLGVTALDVLCAQQLSRSAEVSGNGAHGRPDAGTRVTKTIITNRAPEEAYGLWRELTNLPKFMSHLESVQVTGDKRSHWVAKVPGGKTVEWDAETVADEPNRRIAWRSLEGSDIQHSGSVEFEAVPHGRGTLVRVEIDFSPRGGAIGAAIAKLFRAAPKLHLEQDLRAFRQLLETGEVVQSDASIHPGMHPAQPAAREATA